MKRRKTNLTETKCPACKGKGVMPVVQPTPGGRIFPPRLGEVRWLGMEERCRRLRAAYSLSSRSSSRVRVAIKSRNKARSARYLALRRLDSRPCITISPEESLIRHSHLRPHFASAISNIRGTPDLDREGSDQKRPSGRSNWGISAERTRPHCKACI